MPMGGFKSAHRFLLIKVKTFRILFLIFIVLGSYRLPVFAQNNRLNTSETIGWYNYFGTFKLSEKFSLHTEYQWRRDNLITDWQQSLMRLGINYHVNPRVLLRFGYGWIETFPYGEIPLNSLGRDFSEHRLFQVIQLAHREYIMDFSHRFMLEQRWVGRYSSPGLSREDEYPLTHRLRYMFRMQAPLKGQTIADRTPYLAMYNEIFVGFGKNVNANVFDQNRLGVLLGYRFNKTIRLEAGYLSQIVQFGRQVNGQNVFQYNNGLIVNANFQFDMRNSSK
jgi:hypothetical protein